MCCNASNDGAPIVPLRLGEPTHPASSAAAPITKNARIDSPRYGPDESIVRGRGLRHSLADRTTHLRANRTLLFRICSLKFENEHEMSAALQVAFPARHQRALQRTRR